MEYGIFGINETEISSEVTPFRDIKQSGFNREGSYIYMVIKEFKNIKYICIGNIIVKKLNVEYWAT